jgi:hypothetical protein
MEHPTMCLTTTLQPIETQDMSEKLYSSDYKVFGLCVSPGIPKNIRFRKLDLSPFSNEGICSVVFFRIQDDGQGEKKLIQDAIHHYRNHLKICNYVSVNITNFTYRMSVYGLTLCSASCRLYATSVNVHLSSSLSCISVYVSV